MATKKSTKSSKARKPQKNVVPPYMDDHKNAETEQTRGAQEQDPKRRIGNFSGAGEHPLTIYNGNDND